MTVPIHPRAGVNRDSVDVNTESYTTFVISDNVFLLIQGGKLALFRFFNPYSIIPDTLKTLQTTIIE